MSDESHSTALGANVITEHYCDSQEPGGTRCRERGCYVFFEESKAINLWYYSEHQPLTYQGWPPHGQRRAN